MKKILPLLFLVLVFSANTCHHKIPNSVEEKTMITSTDTLNKVGLDSLIVADSLSFDIKNDWISSMAISEQKESLYKYAFIKNLTDSTGIIYTLYSYQDTLYIINKIVIE